MQSFDIRQDGDRVLLIKEGRLIANMPYSAAKELARALIIQSARAETEAKALQVAADHAILLRTGAPFGLTNRPDIRDEAAKIALYDKDLRRFIPGGVKSKEHVAVPSVILGAPKYDPIRIIEKLTPAKTQAILETLLKEGVNAHAEQDKRSGPSR